jgi:hypothetical protein
LPAICAPTARIGQVVAAQPLVDARRSGTPVLKDLGIQPETLTRAQWQSLLRLASSAGVGVINVGVGWSALEPTGPSLDPAATATLAQFVADARRLGIATRFQLYGFPQWARSSGEPTEAASPWLAPTTRAELAEWAAWVKAIVGQFRTSVAFYEIWNEENQPQFWAQGADPAQYAALLVCSDVAAKSTSAKVVVISGGLSTNDVGFLERLYADLDAYPQATEFHHFFDLLGVHPYSGGRSPAVQSTRWIGKDRFGQDDTNFLGFVRLHGVMARYGDGDKQIYLGEYGVPVQGFSPRSIPGFISVPLQTQTAWVSLAYRLASRYPYVAALSWYAFYPDSFDLPAWTIVHNPDSEVAATTTWVTTSSYDALAKVPSGHVRGR